MIMSDTRSTGAIMTMGKEKKFRDMSLDEQIIYYQNKASQLKKKQAEQLADHHRTIGRIFEDVFGCVTGTDEEIKATLNKMSHMISAYQHHASAKPSSTKQAPASAVEPASAAGLTPPLAAQSPAGPN